MKKVFHQSCAIKDMSLSQRKILAWSSRVALSLWLSPVSLTLVQQRGEDFGLGIVGREASWQVSVFKEHRCETLGP